MKTLTTYTVAELQAYCKRLSVILNEVKDQYEVRDVYANRYSRKVILHFVQDDREKAPALVYVCCV